MTAQAVLGRLRPDLYRDPEWIRATWLGNDWISLLVAVPLLAAALTRRSPAGRLLAMGVMTYAIYNYAFYLFGGGLNAFFPLYVLASWLAVAGLVAELRSPASVPHLSLTAWPKLTGAYLFLVALLLTAVWTALWAGDIFAGHPAPPDRDAFRIVAATDLLLLVPMLAVAGATLWRGHPLAGLVAPIAAVQGALYLAVLATNSAIAVALGLSKPPAELPIWIPLLLLTTAAAAILLRSVETSERSAPPRRDRSG